ncbi:8-amino-7-oxononanoate synthase [candidate division KSB1 bacterium]|nr:MAG: 8-amino-7-oxononanoate synthase [candidate division KSB1 bacterium 4484_219]RKY80215.1 MAG: 8-amino-7-oxononanoate synthase [candidate division KSB1 bacterium]RKY89434.1 MAG: 8-amino-7-oxononanoate synthase [candidate division KSB1 bacterium]RKY92463.1 MAG: 8-amino-7-oxononanoate synthase [candidate division KSB1 bacterium]
MDLFDKCRNYTAAREAIKAGYYPYFKAIQSGAETSVEIDGRNFIMIGSNNYLGLTQHPKVKEAAIKAVEKYGSGCTGSRFLNGTLDIHEELEYRLAKFMRREAALTFSTGFQTNLGTIATLISKDDVIFGDRDNHASIVDGCRLAFGRLVKYRHNDMKDLDRLLQRFDHVTGKLIVTDGVFSMGGDIVNLPELVTIAEKHNAKVFVDDAHSIGVLGKHGRGTAEHYGLEDRVDIVMGTFSKSFASIGGFIASDAEVIDFIKHNARALIFSASMPPAAVAATLAALDIIESEPERRTRLWQNTKKMQEGFSKLGFNIGNTQTPIVPIIIGDNMKTFTFWRALFNEGVFVNPVISPAVPPGMSLLRTSYMATHSDAELDKVLYLFEKIGKQLGVIE